MRNGLAALAIAASLLPAGPARAGDHLVPPEACELLTQKVGSRDTEDICLDTGHVGIYVSSRFQKELVPKIASWLLQRDG